MYLLHETEELGFVFYENQHLLLSAMSMMSWTRSVPAKGDSGQTPEFDLRSIPLNVIPRIATEWGLMGLVGYALVRSLTLAKMQPFITDEVFTQIVCDQRTLSGIWKALSQGADGQPPLFYLIERSTSWVVSNEHIGYRLLSVLGFVCTLIPLYIFVKTRNGKAPALVSACLLMMTPLFTIYATEARPYTPLTACIAIALVCFQRAPAGTWVAGLFLSLSLASALHYFALFALFPFFFAELTVVYETTKVRFWVWLALLAPLVPLAISWPLLMGLKQHWMGALYAKVSLRTIVWTYASYFGLLPPWGIALVGAVIAVMLASFWLIAWESRDLQGSACASERVLVLGLIASPMIGFAVAKFTHAPFVDRYFLPAILGIAAGVGYVLGRVRPKGVTAVATFVLFAFLVQEFGFWTSPRHRVVPAEQVVPLTNLAKIVHHEDLPIVVSDLATYVVFWHYAPPELRRRIVALADPANASIYGGNSVADQLLLAQRSYEPLAVWEFIPFTAEHPVFLLYSGSLSDWWPVRLADEGYRMQLLGVQSGAAMYLVELKTPPN
jgi:hypothetical protein